MTLFIDWSNLMYRCLFVSRRQDPFDEEFKLCKHIMFKCLVDDIKLFKPDEVIVAGDGRNPWRREIYPEYKAGRGKVRDESPVDFEKFFEVMGAYWDEMKDTFTNIKWLMLERVEADDIVGVLVKNMNRECKAITTDKDYVQLLKYRNFQLFNPVRGEYVKSINPRMELDVKCICGDKSDNIKGIKQGVGPKRAERLLTEGTLDEYLGQDESAKNTYVLNRRLIDMDRIPDNIQTEILENYKNYPKSGFDGEKFRKFIMKNNPSMILETSIIAGALSEIKTAVNTVEWIVR